MAFASLHSSACASALSEGTLSGDYLSGRLAARVNALEDAARVYAGAHAAAPGETSLLKDAFFYHLAAGKAEAAMPYAEALLARAPNEDDGLARAATAAKQIKEGALEEARATLGREGGSLFLRSLAFLADVWVEKGLAGPEAALKKLASPPPELFNGFNQYHEGLLASEAGRTDQARAAFEAAVQGHGGPLARRAYGALLERVDAAKAREYYAILAFDDGASRSAARMAEQRLAAGRPSKEFMGATPAQGAAAAIYSFAAAMIYEAQGERDRALEAGFRVGEPRFNYPLVWARLALYLDPDLDEARLLVGFILSRYADHEGEAAVLRPIAPSSPYFEQARIDMASGLMSTDRIDEAEQLLKDAIRRDPNGLGLQATLAALYSEQRDHESAVATLSKVIAGLGEAPPRDAWRYYVARGASLIELDRWPDAEIDLKRAVTLAPDEPMALNYLGYSWAERGLYLDQAFTLLEKAIEKAPQSGAIVDSLGWAQYQLGLYGEAVLNLEKAATMEPSDPTITDHLGDVYWRLGRRLEARYQWERALELEPTDVQQVSIKSKLAQGLPSEPDKKAADRRE